jgi:hypothetical protein
MSVEIVNQPFPHFTNDSGEELDNGYIYIGTAGSDPESNPITVYWDQALTIPASQPLRTVNGYISRNGSASGSPSRVWVGTDYSIKVKDRREVAVYTSLSGNSLLVSGVIDASDVTYNQGGVDAVDRTQRSKNQEFVSAEDFGFSTSGTAAENTSALNSAIIEAATASTAWYEPNIVNVQSGTYAIGSIAVNDLNVWLKGNGTVLQFTDAVGIDVGSAADLDVLTGGLHSFRMSGFRIEAAASSIAIRNRGYRTFQLEHIHVKGGAVGLDTQGAFAKSYALDVTCQSQTSIGFDIKIQNNLMKFVKCRALSNIPIGVRLGSYSGSPPSFELEGVTLDHFDVSGCVNGTEIEGLIKNLKIDTMYTESNTGKDILIENASGGMNKQGILLQNCHLDSSASLGTDFGTDESGTTIRNLNVIGCEFADSASRPAWVTSTSYEVGDKVTSNLTARSITGATQANPVVLTMDTDKLNDGDDITISGVVGMTELNGNTYEVKVTKVGGNPSVELVGIDGTGFTAYTSGGTATPTKNAVYRCQVDHTSGTFQTDLDAGNWADSSVSFIGGSKILDSRIDSFFTGVTRNNAAQTGLINDSTSNHTSGIMPQYLVNPALAFGTTDTKGMQGEIRYEDGWQYIKTAGGHQRTQITDFNDSNNLLPALPTGTTPDVTGLKSARTNNGGAIAITEFLNAKAGHELILHGSDSGNTTVNDGTYISLAGSVNFTLTDNSTIHLLCRFISGGRSYFSEVSRSSN